MNTFIYLFLSSLFISLGALAGAVTLLLNHKKLQSMLLTLVSLSAGTLMGGAFLHLLPEAVEVVEPTQVFTLTLASFIGFFLIERVLHWHHCHKDDCDVHSIGYMNLIGDGVHNFLDGLILAAAFSVDVSLGLATALAIALHEIPQEISDFGVLLHAGWKAKQALIVNFLVALTTVLGAIIGFYWLDNVEQLSGMLMPIAAGGFLYIAAADLMPELRQEKNRKHSLLHLVVFILGVALMYVLAQAE